MPPFGRPTKIRLGRLARLRTPGGQHHQLLPRPPARPDEWSRSDERWICAHRALPRSKCSRTLGPGIGIAAGLHFACATPAIRYGSDFYTCSHLLEDDLIIEPLRAEAGDLLVPDGSGLGISVDWDAVERYRAT